MLWDIIVYNLSTVKWVWRINMFCERLKKIRHEKGLTAQHMEECLGMMMRSYRNYESGDREPSIDTIVKIADILDVSLDYLLCRDEYINRNR